MHHQLRLLISVIVVSLVALLATTVPRPVYAGERCSPQTNQCVGGCFYHFWEQNGGLEVFGHPITPAREERNTDTGKTHLTQWFERARFEDHGTRDVLLGLLGVGDTTTCARVTRVAPASTEGAAIGRALLEGIRTTYPEATQSGPVEFDRVRAIDRAGDWILFNASFKRGLEPAIFVLQAAGDGYRLVDVGWAGAPGHLTAADIRAAIARIAPAAPPELVACASLEGFV